MAYIAGMRNVYRTWLQNTFRDDVFSNAGSKNCLAIGEPRIGRLSRALQLQLISLLGLGIRGFEETDCSL